LYKYFARIHRRIAAKMTHRAITTAATCNNAATHLKLYTTIPQLNNLVNDNRK